MRTYQKPEVVYVEIDSDISMIMMSIASSWNPYNHNASTDGYSSQKLSGNHIFKQNGPDYGNNDEYEIGNQNTPFSTIK